MVKTIWLHLNFTINYLLFKTRAPSHHHTHHNFGIIKETKFINTYKNYYLHSKKIVIALRNKTRVKHTKTVKVLREL